MKGGSKIVGIVVLCCCNWEQTLRQHEENSICWGRVWDVVVSCERKLPSELFYFLCQTEPWFDVWGWNKDMIRIMLLIMKAGERECRPWKTGAEPWAGNWEEWGVKGRGAGLTRWDKRAGDRTDETAEKLESELGKGKKVAMTRKLVMHKNGWKCRLTGSEAPIWQSGSGMAEYL